MTKQGTFSGEDFGEDTRTLMDRLQGVKDDLRATQENFISRERAYQLRIEELEVALLDKRQAKIGWMKSHPKISKLKNMQSQILSNVALVQDRFSRVMQEQERDLLRAFQARLLDVQAELEMQKSKQDDGAVAYIELSKLKEYDVEKEKVRADLKERQNQALLQGNNRLKSQFTSREEDRNFLVLQINAARQDNARLRAEHEEHDTERGTLESELQDLRARITENGHGSPHRIPRSKFQSSAQALQAKIDQEERYKEVNQRLRKLLAEERHALQQVRQNFNNEVSARTDMEMLLRGCWEEVSVEGEKRLEAFSKYTNKKMKVIEDDADQQARDRERVLELLLSKEQVVNLIYSKSNAVAKGHFTQAPGSPSSGMEGMAVGLMDLDADDGGPSSKSIELPSPNTSSKLPPLKAK